MKKVFSLVAIFFTLLLCFQAVLASGGDANDPLISLSFLEGLFTQNTENSIDSALNSADQTLYSDVEKSWDTVASTVITASQQKIASVPQEITLNQGNSVSGADGLFVTPLAGNICAVITAGTVIDATTGEEIPDGTALTVNHRYLVAEDSFASFISTSPTAILSYQGVYQISDNNSVADFYGTALALRALNLFRGSGSGIGSGFDLHATPTRAEALVMFIRLLGEEADALSCTFSHPFTDVPAWMDRYAAWAWEKGYTNGISETKFGTSQQISAVEYQEFLLRALGYSTAGVDDYRTSMERALLCGALTDAEYLILSQSPFLRAHIAYLSYYNLDTMLHGHLTTLAQHLEQQGVITSSQLQQARTAVTSPRLH